ncbi:unnamed protein product [Macrosiphum euphorbiae]|uniref:Uncharacterized protein n=1 Tax=Macrosiphum euphorbiae TaxID=13131 RepID=A0AAV0X4M5_9HEMI|nr:unnamed protein product [Macrosiphum euphorbiae]
MMSSIGGPKKIKRQLLMPVAQSQLLYAATVWALALVFEKKISGIPCSQRLMVISSPRDEQYIRQKRRSYPLPQSES